MENRTQHNLYKHQPETHRTSTKPPSSTLPSRFPSPKPQSLEPMARPSSAMATASFVTFLFSIPIFSGGIWLRVRASTDCIRYFDTPFIVLGTALLAVSIAGMIGASKGSQWPVSMYLILTPLIMIALFGFTVFAFKITYEGAAWVEEGRGYAEFKLSDGSSWLKKRVEDHSRWVGIKNCLQDKGLCRWFQDADVTFYQFIYQDFSPSQSGCCKPPYECAYIYRNATTWDAPVTGSLFNNSDCKTWRNDPNTLCYDCQSCKAGVVATVNKDWKKIAILNIVFISFFLI